MATLACSAFAGVAVGMGSARGAVLANCWVVLLALLNVAIACRQATRTRRRTMQLAWWAISLSQLAQALVHVAVGIASLGLTSAPHVAWTLAAPMLAVVPLSCASLLNGSRLLETSDRIKFGLDVTVALLLGATMTWFLPRQAPSDAGLQVIVAGAALLLSMLDTIESHTGAEDTVTRSTVRTTVLPYLSVGIGSVMVMNVVADTGNARITLCLGAMLTLMLLVIVRQAIAVRDEAVRTTQAARLAGEMRFQSLVQHSSDLITILDGADTIRYTSPAIGRVFGYEAPSVDGHLLREFVHPDDVVHMLQFLADAALPGEHATSSQWRMRHADGSWCTVENLVVNLVADDTVGGLALTTRDVSQRVALEDQLVHRAFHDGLTGLANRALFTNRVEQALLRASRTALRTTVLFLDLDDFKEINDSLGHAAGDRLLVLGADRLRACLRAGDTAARLGGDEFAVLLEECPDDGEEALQVAQRIAQAFAHSFSIEDREVFSTASIGLAISARDDTAEDLLRNADLAMYLAKKRGKARVELFARHMHDEVVERLDMLADMRCAIERNELQLEYQPIVDLATRTVTGLETLVRWDHPKRGRISPVDFIPLAEQSGLIVAIGRWVLLHACAHARHWSRTLPQLQPVT
ncbi:MAG TPA: diguanylate cyclase, partial [Gemmatimonadaceae bacterium]|nr:diguanylate cyclase [Gemmatimonadaceae bacterium]